MSNELELRLFILGQTMRSQRAITNIRRLCDMHLSGRYVLHIVDVLERPDLAELYRIIATPTLVKELPPPRRYIVGDLSDPLQVIRGLDIEPSNDPPSPIGDIS